MPVCCDVLWVNTGLSFVCRDENDFKDNSGHCVCVLHSFSLSLCVLLFSSLYFFWVFMLCRVLWVALFLGWFLCFSLVLFFLGFSPSLLPGFGSLFIELESFPPKSIPSLQDCYSNHERDHGQKTWSTIGSNLLQIFSLLNRDGDDEHSCSQQRRRFQATRGHFQFDPWTLEISQLDP